MDLWFAEIPPEQPTLLFQHIRKTGGTSFRKVLVQNMREAQPRYLDASETSLADFWEALTLSERDKLVGIAGHSANHLLPATDRPVWPVTLLRNPVERVLSRYYFFKQKRNETLREFYLRDNHKGYAWDFFNGQARSLLGPDHDLSDFGYGLGPGADADLWRTRLRNALSEYRVVGLQERFTELVQTVGQKFDWTYLKTPRLRVNAERPHGAVDEDTCELIRQANWLDVELYARYSGRDEPEIDKSSAEVVGEGLSGSRVGRGGTDT